MVRNAVLQRKQVLVAGVNFHRQRGSVAMFRRGLEAFRRELARFGAVRRVGAGMEEGQLVMDLGGDAQGRTWLVAFPLIEVAGERPRSRSTLGSAINCTTRRARAECDTTSRHSPLANRVSKPDRPVITVRRSRGRSRQRFFSLCVRALRTLIWPWWRTVPYVDRM